MISLILSYTCASKMQLTRLIKLKERLCKKKLLGSCTEHFKMKQRKYFQKIPYFIINKYFLSLYKYTTINKSTFFHKYFLNISLLCLYFLLNTTHNFRYFLWNIFFNSKHSCILYKNRNNKIYQCRKRTCIQVWCNF